jgi:toxin FitB
MYLLDTNTLSETSPTKVKPRTAFTAWLERNGDSVFLSVVSVTEIAYGIKRARDRGATRKAALLDAWLHDVTVYYADRVIAVDSAIAKRAGELLATAQAGGREASIEDAWIAATADCRNLTVLTDNVRDFLPMRVAYHNPFDGLPS